MGIFGFGKKKQQPAHEPKHVPKSQSEPSPTDLAVASFLNMSKAESPAQPAPKSWSESVDQFLARNENAKLVKLTGKPEDLSFYDVGNRCKVEYDDEKEKYAVSCGGSVIGFLPASAVTYAEKHDCPPDDLAVIIAEVDYDMEKDRDIISVYISD